MSSQVYWYTTKELTYLPKLNGNEKAEVVIVGGGMAGLSAAQRIIKEGCSVTLIEKDFCGSGASGKTSGFITPESEIELSVLVSNYGSEKAKRIWEFVLSGVEIIRKNIIENKIECDYQIQDSLFIGNNNAGYGYAKKEHETRQSLNYKSTLHNRESIKNIIGSLAYVGGAQYPDTFGMNSFLYCQALRDILINQGVKIFEQTSAVSIKENLVITNEGSISADFIIVCADRFIPDLKRMEKEIYHVQTFLGISKPLSDRDMDKVFPKNKMMVWDTDSVYNYFRAIGQNRLLIGGGVLFYSFARSVSYYTKWINKIITTFIKHKYN